MANSERFTLSMSEEADQHLSELSETLNTSKAGVMRKSLKAFNFLINEAGKDREIVIKSESGDEVEITDLLL